MVIQIIVVIFALFAISRAIYRFRSKQISLREVFLWIIIWLIGTLVVLLPSTTDYLARLLGVGRGVDAIIYLSIIGIVYALFRVFVKLEHIEHEITTIVRKAALKDQDKEDQ
ncbi:MAG: DUF2304 family protein [bacterium]